MVFKLDCDIVYRYLLYEFGLNQLRNYFESALTRTSSHFFTFSRCITLKINDEKIWCWNSTEILSTYIFCINFA